MRENRPQKTWGETKPDKPIWSAEPKWECVKRNLKYTN